MKKSKKDKELYRKLFNEIYEIGIKDPRRDLADATVEVFTLNNIPLEDAAKYYKRIPAQQRMILRRVFRISEGNFPKYARNRHGGLHVYRNGNCINSWKVIKSGRGCIIYYGSRKSKEEAMELLKEVEAKEAKEKSD
jgi:hypothetical protein